MNFNDFDKEFNKMEKRTNRMFKGVLIFNIIAGLFSIGIVALIIYVIAHFIGKVW